MSLRRTVRETRTPSSAPTVSITISDALGLRPAAVPQTTTPYVPFAPQYPTPIAVKNVVDDAFRFHTIDEVPTDGMFSDFKNQVKEKGGKLMEATKNKGKEVLEATKKKANDTKEKYTGLYNYQYSTHLDGQLYSLLVVAKKYDYKNAEAKYNSIPFEEVKATMLSGGVKAALKVKKKPIDTKIYATLKSKAEEQAKLMMVQPTNDVALAEGKTTYKKSVKPGRNAAVLGFSETTREPADLIAQLETRFSKFKLNKAGDPQEFATIPRVPEGVSFSGSGGLKPITALVMETYNPPPTAKFKFPPHDANSGVDYTSKTLSSLDEQEVADGAINELFPNKVFGIYLDQDSNNPDKPISVGATILVPAGEKMQLIEEYGIVTNDKKIESALANALSHKNVDLLLLWNAFKFANTAKSLQTARFSSQDKKVFEVLFGSLNTSETIQHTDSAYGEAMYDLNDMHLRPSATGVYTEPALKLARAIKKRRGHANEGLEFADASLKKDRDIVMKAVTKNGKDLEFADASLQKDRNIVMAAVTQDGSALEFADASLQTSRDIVMAAVTRNGQALEFADAWCKSDPDIVMAAVITNGDALYYADPLLKEHRDIVLAAVTQDGSVLDFADEDLKKDPAIVLRAVTQDGRALEHVDVSLQKNYAIVLVAVTHQGWALQYAGDDLKKNDKIVMAAVTQDGYALDWAAPSLKKDYDIVLAAVTKYGRALKYADDDLKKNHKIVMAAVTQDGRALEFADETLKTNHGINAAALASIMKMEVRHGP